MKKSSYFWIGVFIAIFWLTFGFFYWFVRSPYFAGVNVWITQNKILFIVLLYVYKSLSLLWPPFPSGLFTLVSIPFLGWPAAYFIDLLGSISGGSIAYFLGKKYGYWILNKLFDKSVVSRIRRTKIKKGREIEAVFIFRVFMGTTILEAIYYGAGVLRINFWKFLIGASLSHLVVGVPSFLLAENIFAGRNLLAVVIFSLIGLVIVYKTKGRYFE